MKMTEHTRICKYLLCTTMLVFTGVASLAQSGTLTKTSTQQPAPKNFSMTERDGQHDFDFEFGQWKIHNRRLLHPLSGSNEWVEFDGTVVAQPIWDGRANLDVFEADSPTGHIEGMTVRTYNTTSHQWSLYWATSKTGVFSLPATVGKFDGDRGEFYDQEDYNGRNILVRFLWTVTSPEAPQWEQAFSPDGGKTWETNWIVNFTRVKP
jgi:hypothetical protein